MLPRALDEHASIHPAAASDDRVRAVCSGALFASANRRHAVDVSVESKRRYMIHFSTGDAAMRFYDEQLEVGTLIERRTCEVWRVEQPRQVEGLGHAWAKLIAV